MLDLIGGVARKVGCKRLDARDDAMPRHGVDRVAHLCKRRAIVKHRVDSSSSVGRKGGRGRPRRDALLKLCDVSRDGLTEQLDCR